MRIRRSVGILGIGFLAVLYFSYHSVRGENGLMAWWQIRGNYSSIKQKVELSSHRLKYLRITNSQTSNEGLDLDNLEREARKQFMGSRQDLIVVHQ